MESKQSGLVTPPIVSPRPVQNKSTNQQPLTADESWKVVGSPPRRPLLSPPDEREREREREREKEREREEDLSRTLQDVISTDMDRNRNTFEGLVSTTTTITNRTTTTTTTTTTDSSVSSSSPKSSPPTPATLYPSSSQFKSKGEETLVRGPLDSSPLPDAPIPFHFKSASTGTHKENHLVTNSFLFDTPSSPTRHRHPGYESLSESSTFLFQGHAPLSPNYGLDRTPGSQRLEDGEKIGAHDLLLNQFLWDDAGTNFEGSSNHRGIPSSKYPPPLDTSSARLSDPIFPGAAFRNGRSLSFSEPSFSSVRDGEGSSTSTRPGLAKSTFPSDDDPLMDMRTYRSSLLPTMEEETEDSTEQRMSRARSFSTSATFGLSPFGLSSPGFASGSNAFGPAETDVFANNTSFMSGNQSGVGSGNSIHHNSNNNIANTANTAVAVNTTNTTNTSNSSSRPFLHRKLSGGLPAWSSPSSTLDQTSNHRRSLTSNASYSTPIWEMPSLFQPLKSPVEQDRMDRHRVARRFSLAPSMSSSSMHHYDNSDSTGAPGFGSNSSGMTSFQRHPFDNDNQGAQRRHSVAGSSGAYLRSNIQGSSFKNLASSLESLHLDEDDDFEANDMDKLNNSWTEYYDQEDLQSGPGYDSATGGQGRQRVSSTGTSDLGKGLTLGQLPHHGSLYVVEFKAGRNDLFYMTGGVGDSTSPPLKRGDLVIVEADRGKDLGKIANDSITPQQIQALQAQQAEMAAIAAQQDLSGMGMGMGSGMANSTTRTPKEIHPKRIFRLAQPSEVALLVSKNQDEMKAMVVCQSKVRQKKLPMEVVDAEYQWDRRKLTFYFIAERRIDFRELVRDLFKIYKTRIWMYAVNPLMSSGISTSGPSASNSSLTSHNTSGHSGSDATSPLGLSRGCGPMSPSPPPLSMPSGLRSPSSPRVGLSLSILPQHHQQYQYSSSSAGLTSPRLQQHSASNSYQQQFQQMQSPQQQKQSYGSQHSGFSQPHLQQQQQQQQHPQSYPQQQQQQQRLSMYQQQPSPYSNIMPLMQTQQQPSHSYPSYAHSQSP